MMYAQCLQQGTCILEACARKILALGAFPARPACTQTSLERRRRKSEYD